MEWWVIPDTQFSSLSSLQYTLLSYEESYAKHR